MILPNIDQVLSIVRWLLSVGGPVGALLVAKGVPAEQVTTLQTSIIAILASLPPIISFVWSMHAHTEKSTVQSAAAIPETVVITNPALAQATPDQKNIVPNTLTNASIAVAVKDAKVSNQKETS